MARQSSHRPETDEPGNEPVGSDGAVDPGQIDAGSSESSDDTAGTGDAPATSGTADRSLWEEVRIDPVEIALPSGSGFTLRAYRPASELTLTDIEDREHDDLFASRSRRAEVDEDEDDDETVVILDEEVADQFAEAEKEEAERDGKSGAADPDAEAAETEAEEEDEGEEVPAFLTYRGKLLLFKSPEALVTFVRSGAPHDLADLDTWDQLVERITPADVAPLDEDSYELDLVVENLRGGHDVWDSTLLIEAGEVARDLAYALRLPAVLDMLSPGSSLDDLDEALRATVAGGLGGFRGRRRLKKIGAQTASLGWRTIIGKISAAVDWRD
ncbi:MULTISPECIES: DNA primase [unclassified Plantactinospora]|uniref:DNA primase n=1 Tax=unclassified Plantactinospora TaxID=2631981 RepID=UPI000D17BCF0|nr:MULTISPECIES: DNA primase [unclassified Plantactinospora]AVT30187.1 DNA primase [Plantactinospora sp. BC1]AVT36703.1 DNA primase [Plantactinospora sp. BB1]